MHILMLSWRDPKHPLAGGAEQVMHEHAKGWVGVGHKVTLFSSASSDNLNEELLDGVRIIRRGSQILGVHFEAFKWYLFENKENYSLVIDQFHGIPFFTPIYVRAPKLAVLQEVAREVWFLNHLKWPLNWIIGGVGYFFEPFIFLFYRRTPFMVGSNSAKEDLSKMGINRKNISVVPHGVVIEKIREYKKEKVTTIIFLGALAHDKGIEDALKAFAKLAKNGEFQFWVVGKGSPEYLAFLKRLGKTLGIEKRIKFWGFVTQEKKFELLKKSHILINPSVREGWGLVNIEANAVGTPVVSYNSPGLIDSVKDGESGVLVKENTPEALAEACIQLVDDKNFYNRLSKSSVVWSKNFSWEKSRKLSLQLIKIIVSRK